MPEWPAAHGTSLSAAQQRAVLDADPVTGEVTGSQSVLRALVAKRLAETYGRRGARYLTDFGRQVRARLEAAHRAAPEPGPESGFTTATGEEIGAPEPAPGRAAAAAAAWESLLEIRRMTGGGTRPEQTPAAWERTRTVAAVALTLEAAGVPAALAAPSGRRLRAGYLVTEGAGPGRVRVEWRALPGTPAAAEAERRLESCAALLTRWGWEALLYQASGGVRFLTVAAPPP
ncbi:hypothetical protein [Peterkaempfera sp. SMS 1(5)a]|uniref:hypothetical protein n=1 Tax=Peterkaempfera podocarpi TaxID=3232308 RepID=UPI00366E888F